MEILGHSNVQTTMMIYREVTQDAKRQGIAKMDFLTLDPQKLWSTREFGVLKIPRSELRIGALEGCRGRDSNPYALARTAP
jgi:hypothetical protein